jgi:Ca-activated chloride channel family protein
MAGAWQDGMQAYQQERYAEALKHFLQAQVDDPENPKLLYNLGNTYYRLGKYKAALEHYERAQATAPEPLKQQSLYNAGNASYRNGMLEDAIGQYTAALQIDPDDRLARENLEFVKARLQQQPRKGDGNENNEGHQDEKDKSDRSDASERKNGPSNRQNRADDTGRTESDQTAARQNQSARNDPQNSPPADPGSQTRRPARPPQDKGPGGSRLKNGPNEHDISQAERILNRLNDQPGKALMPVYEKRIVEKDW